MATFIRWETPDGNFGYRPMNEDDFDAAYPDFAAYYEEHYDGPKEDEDGPIPYTLSDLHDACKSKNLMMFEALLDEQSSDINETLNREALLHTAATASTQNGDTSKLKLLLSKSADINVKDHWGNTPLHRAAMTYYYESEQFFGRPSLKPLEILLKRNAFINAQNDAGETPLHHAHNEKVLKMLLMYGPDTTIIDLGDLTAIECIENECDKYSTDFKKIKQVYENALEELEKLKGIKLNSDVSLRDILIMPSKKMNRYVQNAVFQEMHKKCNGVFKKEFSVYGDVLEIKYKKGLKWNELKNNFKKSLKHLTGMNIPDLCYEELFRFLNKDDINNTINSSKINGDSAPTSQPAK